MVQEVRDNYKLIKLRNQHYLRLLTVNGTFKKIPEVYVADDVELCLSCDDLNSDIAWFPSGQSFCKLMRCLPGLKYLSKELTRTASVSQEKIPPKPSLLTLEFKR